MEAIGVLGLYVGKIFQEVKARPTYVVRSTRGLEGEAAARIDARKIASREFSSAHTTARPPPLLEG